MFWEGENKKGRCCFLLVSLFFFFLLFGVCFSKSHRLSPLKTLGVDYVESRVIQLLLPLSSGNVSTGERCEDLRRIVRYPPEESNTETETTQKVAIFLQIGNIDLWEGLLDCTSNILIASLKLKFQVDVFIGTHSICEEDLLRMMGQVSNKEGNLGLILAQNFNNEGEDVGIFLKQLRVMSEMKEDYDLALKFHTKSDFAWRNRAVQCLCGTPFQVESIWNQFQEKGDMAMIGPLGQCFGADTPEESLAYNLKEKFVHFTSKTPFNLQNVAPLRNLIKYYYNPWDSYNSSFTIPREDLFIVAGTMFWIRIGRVEISRVWEATLKMGGFRPGYKTNGRVEHVLERFFPTFFQMENQTVGEITPAPLPLVVYPSHHIPRIETRQKQGEMAKQAGIYAFVYEHFWFPGENKHSHRLPELILEEGEPNISFMLSWENEPDIQMGGERGWREHFYYLQRFFSHPNYVKIEQEPVFFIKRIGSLETLMKMLNYWERRSIQMNLPRLKVILPASGHISYSHPFIHGVYHKNPPQFSTQREGGAKSPLLRQFWGTNSASVDSLTPENYNTTTEKFSKTLHNIFYKMSATGGREVDTNLFFLNSWGGWKGQATLEPDSSYGRGLWDALQTSLRHVPALSRDDTISGENS